MAGEMHQSRGGGVWAIVSRQHGVVSRAQLLERGLRPKGIEHRIATGRLFPVHAGVYAVGRPQVTQHGRWTAAVLACGPGAVLSHTSAAELWGLLPPRAHSVEISVPAGIHRHRGARSLS